MNKTRRFSITVDVPEEWLSPRFPSVGVIQGAFDSYWALAEMGTIKVLAIAPVPEPTSNETDG